MGQVGWGMVAVHGGNCIHGVLWAFFFLSFLFISVRGGLLLTSLWSRYWSMLCCYYCVWRERGVTFSPFFSFDVRVCEEGFLIS